MSDELFHYGTPRHSGRYPWGSGEDPYQHEAGFMGRVRELRDAGMTEVQIAKAMGMSTGEYRAQKSLAVEEERAANIAMAQRLHDKGYSNVAIGEKMGGVSESTVRSWLKPGENIKANLNKAASDVLRNRVDSAGFIDVGAGTERMMGISDTRLNAAIKQLESEGYVVQKIKVEQLGTGHKTDMKVLCPPGTEWKDVINNQDKIKLVNAYTENGGKTFLNIEPPRSVSSERVAIRYGDQRGKDKDGVIELRRGVEDISLGESRYAQVRIAVDGTHYLKGMAMYSDNMPDGVDIIFNTNKPSSKSKMEVLKEMKKGKDGNIDPDNPFGATIKIDGQRHYIDKDGKDQLSCINKVNEEGDWSKWQKSLSSQMLSKQPVSLAKQQLDLDYKLKKEELDDILKMTNPSVKKRLLESFSDDCDSSAAHLKAAGLPRQASHVILPLTGIKDTEIYAPNYNDGETVALIRYPHAGRFEIPVLTVNNRNQEGKSTLGNARDAVGIHPNVAERLSGADFDGDTVLVIPNNRGEIKSHSPLAGLKDFDPKVAYPKYEGMPVMKERTKQIEMGKVSNLITDMTLKGANEEELAAAVRHSMVVIDAPKHELNYKQSYIDNGIANLKQKYQAKEEEGKYGASTIISRSNADMKVPERSETFRINKETGEKIYKETGRHYLDKTGKEKPATSEVKGMDTVTDARKLMSGNPKAEKMEGVYADYANKMKAMANEARKESLAIRAIPVSKSAKETYRPEIESLESKLAIAEKNAPFERQAQLAANSYIRSQKRDNPDMEKSELKKLKSQALAAARYRVGAKKEAIKITEKEWEAIQSGAFTKSKADKIIANADLDTVRKYASPRANIGLTSSQIALIKSMNSRGYTTAEMADRLGVSTSTVDKYL